MRLLKPALIVAGLLVAAASAAPPAMADDDHGWKHRKHWKHGKHHHHHYHGYGPPVRYISRPVIVERPVIYRGMTDYVYYGPPPPPSLNINIPLR